MTMQWGFTFEASEMQANSVYDVMEDKSIALSHPITFSKKENRLKISQEDKKILPKSVLRDYAIMATSLIINDPEQTDRLDILKWLTDHNISSNMTMYKNFVHKHGKLKCYVDVYFTKIDDALKFKLSFGDYGIKPIED